MPGHDDEPIMFDGSVGDDDFVLFDLNRDDLLTALCSDNKKSDDGVDEELSTIFDECSDDRKKVTRALVTWFVPNMELDWLDHRMYFEKAPLRWCAQYEYCPETGSLHCHAFFELKRADRMRFKALRTAFLVNGVTRVHIRLPRSVSKFATQCAVNYCTDPKKRAPNTDAVFFCESGTPWKFDDSVTKKRKLDSEKEEQRLHIESKPRWLTWEQILHENEYSKALLCACSWGPRYHAARSVSDARRTIQRVVIYYGAGGTGKSTEAKNLGCKPGEPTELGYWKRNPDDGNFFGGGVTAYKGQRVIHFEEFTGNEPFNRFKDYTDIGKEGPPVNIKNGGTFLNHDTVVITSNVHPAGWYRKFWMEDPKQFLPFWRRITEVRFYPELRDDGTVNIPDSANGVEPYFIDQTDEWKDMRGSYDACVRHAEKHWKLPDVDEAITGTGGNGDAYAQRSTFF